MALPPGTRLGVYEVTAQIGAGGMGEVYRATDSNLKRSVAIKVLPASVAGDADRLTRFQREAEVLAALNHPNIAAIYGLEKTSDLTALVMELVEGEDLSERIRRGAIPIDEALPIAKQIAEALEAAHEQGIIHRDLKPANVKVRPDGTVKVLDFGLAKARDQGSGIGDQGSGGLANSPTISMHATEAGIILGTAAYMSPEQASGKRVDKRADVWSFGVVLLEMLTGRRLFDGETTSHTLADVLRGPIELDRLPANTPRSIRDLLRRCLTRDVKKRLRDVGEARIAIEESISGGASEEPAAPRSGASRALPWAVAVVLLVALGIAVWAPWRSEQLVDRPLVRLDVDLGEDAVFPQAIIAAGFNMAISPDGTRLAYVAGTPPRLFTRRLDQPKATELPGTLGAIFPFFSRDGQWIGFGANGKLSKISVEGGAQMLLGESASSGAAWSEDGTIFVSEAFGRGLVNMPGEGGSSKTILARVPGQAGFVVPKVLPGGQAILAASCTLGAADNCTIEVLTLADGRRKIVARGGHSPHYLPAANGIGHLIYINRARLFAVAFDLATLETRGTAVPVLDDVGFAALTGAGLFDVSDTGTLIYRKSLVAGVSPTSTVQWVDAGGKKAPLRTKSALYLDVRLSPVDQRMALSISEGTNVDIWVYDPQRDAIARLTFGGNNRSPVWSPDGQSIVFVKMGEGIFQARADGGSQPQLLMASTSTQVPWSFSPDGKRLAYFEPFSTAIIATVPLEVQGATMRAGTAEQFLTGGFQLGTPAFSPDGRWLAYQSNESGRPEVYVRAFGSSSSGQGGKWQISNSGGITPKWSRTTPELVYQSLNQLMAASYSVKGGTFVTEKPRAWIAGFGSVAGWDLAPDGKRVAALIPDASTQAPQQEHEIVMLFNFADELRRRVPLGK